MITTKNFWFVHVSKSNINNPYISVVDAFLIDLYCDPVDGPCRNMPVFAIVLGACYVIIYINIFSKLSSVLTFKLLIWYLAVLTP